MKKRIKDKLKRNRRKLSPQERELKDLKIIEQNIVNARKLRDALAESMLKKPDPEGLKHLANLNNSIAVEERRLHARFAADLRREFAALAESLDASVDELDEDELLRLGDEAQPVKNLQKFIFHRDRLAEIIFVKMPPEENPAAFIENFNTVIKEVEAKLEQKRARAQKRADAKAEAERRYNETQAVYKKIFPNHVDLRARLNESDEEIPPTPLTDDGTEYEMPEDYKDHLYRWEAAVEMRDLCRREIEKIIAENRQGETFDEFVQSVDELDEWITSTEKHLQEEKRTYQETMRVRAKAEQVVTDYENALQDAIAQNPYILLGGKPKGQ